jgi:hypothetical protein
VFTPYLTVSLLSLEVVHGIMKLGYLYSDVSSMTSRELEQLSFGTGEYYTASVHTIPHSVTTLFGGHPWNYEVWVFVFRHILNDKQGGGTAVFWYM